MSLPDVVTALADHWDQVLPYLQPADIDVLSDLIGSIDEDEDDLQIRVAYQGLVDVLIDRLPAGHQVRRAISGQPRLVTAPTDWPLVADVLTGLVLVRPGSGKPDEGPGAIAATLLAAPALTAEQVRDHGGDPDSDGLIRLRPESGGARLPAFQFGRDGHPIPVVDAINRMLGAADDPWGAADWWLGQNAWLDATPAELVGLVDDDMLIRAARAEFLDA